MTPLIKRFSLVAFILCMMMISCKAYATHYFFEVAVTEDTKLNLIDSSVITFKTPTLYKDYGDSITSSSNIYRNGYDTIFCGVVFDTDATHSDVLLSGYVPITCGEAVTRAKALFSFTNLKYICD